MKTLISLLSLLAVCLLQAGCMTTGSNSLAGGVEQMFPRTANSFQRLSDRVAGVIPRPSYEEQTRRSRQEAEYRAWQNSRYARTTQDYRNSQDYQDYQDFLAWKRSNAPTRRTTTTTATRRPSYNNWYEDPVNQRAVEAEFYANLEEARPRNSQQIARDYEASKASLEKLPWESEAEYRERLRQIQVEANARANRYRALASSQ